MRAALRRIYELPPEVFEQHVHWMLMRLMVRIMELELEVEELRERISHAQA